MEPFGCELINGVCIGCLVEEPLYARDELLACEAGELDALCELEVLLRDVGVVETDAAAPDDVVVVE